MIGTLIQDRYRVDSELGRGGMGIVYRAEDTLLERPVAIKIVSAAGLGTEGRSRLLQEARAAARLNHPNIVAVYDVGEASLPGLTSLPGQVGETSFIIMELIDGQTLREHPYSDLDRIISIARDICKALEIAHEQGIIHRDLKPENVAVTVTDTVKLMDFGLARIAGKTRLTQQGAMLGTLSYMAPEIILGLDAGPCSDLYALGVMLYEMTASRPPFEGADLTAVISQHLHAPVVPPSAYNNQIPPALDHLIVQLLNKRPEDRPDSAEDVVAILDSMVAAAPSLQAPVPELERLVRGRMIGREEEFGRAISLWQKTAAGQGQFLLISGEPGIGKTRMVRELSTFAEISGGKTLTGLCYSEDRTPYGPIAQMVEASLENGYHLELPQPVMADLLTLAPELRLNYPDVPLNERLDPEAEQQRLFESIITWFTALAKDGELLLVVDDVHWADSGSLALLRRLARRIGRHRALVIGTYREVELDEALPFQEMLSDLNRERLATRIKLSRLSKEQTGDLLATLFAEEITPEFLDGIFQETEGNPFFIEEVCKALVDSGELYFEGERWNRPVMEEIEIPQGIRVTIQSRLGKLSKKELSTLQIAALLGRDFEYEMLAAASKLDEDDLIDGLERAEEAQLIEEVRRPGVGAGMVFSFTHALIHSTLLSSLRSLRRQRLQRQVALALEEAFPDKHDELALLLGRYFAEAGDGEKAVRYLLQAGKRAWQVYAYDEAIDAYEQALLFLREESDHQLTARTLMKLGQAYHSTFAFDSSREAYEEGFIEWRRATEFESANARLLPDEPHPLRTVSSTPPVTLDTSLLTDTWSAFLVEHLFSGLLHLTGEDELVPDVAHSWEVLDGGTRYLFHLRDDAIWSDGEPVTAGDFEYSWKRTLNPDLDRNLANLLYDIEGARAYHLGDTEDADSVGVRALGSHTLEVVLEGPRSYFLLILGQSVTRPIPKWVVERHGLQWTDPEKIVTNGPFTIQEWSSESSVILERNPNHHGHFTGNLTEFHIKISPRMSFSDLYESDQIDVLNFGALPPDQINRLIQLHPDEYISIPAASTLYMAFDVRRPPFDDHLVRQAMIMALDYKSIVGRAAKGTNIPGGGGLTPPGIPGHVSDVGLTYDPRMARQKLGEAGYPAGEGFPSVTAVSSQRRDRNYFDFFVDEWKRVLGIDIAYETLSFNDYLDRLATELPHMWMAGWAADYPDPDCFLRVANWYELGGWRNQEYEALIQDVLGMTHQAQRLAMYRQAERIITQEVPVVALSYGRAHWLTKPWVSAFPVSVINGPILSEIVVEDH
jgi:ABC-type oligopeptide transport system substrate-binding subunit/predicted Ser/Thr protein kinase